MFEMSSSSEERRSLEDSSSEEERQRIEDSSLSSSFESPAKKTPVKRKKKPVNPKGKFIVHSLNKNIPREKDVVKIMSFDPGMINFAIRIEERRRSKKKIRTVLQAKHAIPYKREKVESYTQSHSTRNIIELLDSYSKEMKNLDIVIVEGQMDKAREMMHLQHTLISYFLIKYPGVFLVEISSKIKGKNLGAGKLPRPKLKAWSIDKAVELSTVRKDKKFLEYYKQETEDKLKKDIKVDDICDTLIQIEAFCIEIGYQVTGR